jgi:NAD(P)-dependent dehydrogenase (short-subunit alcohol dehydrogenase family)
MQRFEDKVVLVTGGASGIGLAAVRAFSREGAAVVIADLNAGAAEAVAADLPWAIFVKTDVTVLADAERAVATAAETFGGLDVLFSNVGIQTYGTVETLTEADYDRAMNVNFKGHVWMCKYAVPALRDRGGGAIVCTSSVQAVATQKAVPLYAASKAATLALVKAISNDHAREGIRANAVMPGSVDTPMLRWAAERFAPGVPADVTVTEWGKSHPIGRVIRPEEVAQLVLFLCSDDARALTGAGYQIDGGLLAQVPVALPD